MKVKQKAIGEKYIEHSNRYKTIQNHHDSTPSLLKARHYNKENNQNQQNHLHAKEQPSFGPLDHVKSTQLPKRLQTSTNQQEFGQFKKQRSKQYADELRCSQDFVLFRQKMTTEPQEEEFFKGEHVTFGNAGKRNGLLTSREFLEDKKVKNQVIDEMMNNAKRGLCKSFNEFNFGPGNCANHPTKKAKYRLIAQLSEGQKERFYCSKCAINLLQQHFKIEEIKCQETENQDNSLRLQQITKFELRLKSLEERAHLQSDRSNSKAELEAIEEEIQLSNSKFSETIEALERMKNEYISNLNQLYMKKQNEQKVRREEVGEMLANMRDIQLQIKEYKNMKKFALMKENEFQFITSSLANKINKFDQLLQKIKPSSPCRCLHVDNITSQDILQRLQEQLATLQKPRERREREVTFSRREESKQRVSEDEFVCDEMKRPFRVLFPSDETDQSQFVEGYVQKNRMLSSVRQRPTFERQA